MTEPVILALIGLATLVITQVFAIIQNAINANAAADAARKTHQAVGQVQATVSSLAEKT